jgi:2-polyprenyl-3-methyl-5-hydroxy-6-metoxy-1,4-benzoquinol methylase
MRTTLPAARATLEAIDATPKREGTKVTFDEAAFRATLQKAFAENGMAKLLSYERVNLFEQLTRRMLEENEKYNLTAIREPGKIALLHYADCAAVAQYLPRGAHVIDIGCGAGFPTLPLAIVRPDLTITALDSTEKRVKYVAETAALLTSPMWKRVCCVPRTARMTEPCGNTTMSPLHARWRS